MLIFSVPIASYKPFTIKDTIYTSVVDPQIDLAEARVYATKSVTVSGFYKKDYYLNNNLFYRK
ncbi:hypothetical protein D0U04_23060 [Bacillus clarus]|uniref:Uncharacterized protein n=1 Tax=Bacillus clarus TaxID=2338372 RepID=A0ABX9KQ46_9BACI|nr:hypothetical protein D0U04_23060 [Bacillus clarus]